MISLARKKNPTERKECWADTCTPIVEGQWRSGPLPMGGLPSGGSWKAASVGQCSSMPVVLGCGSRHTQAPSYPQVWSVLVLPAEPHCLCSRLLGSRGTQPLALVFVPGVCPGFSPVINIISHISLSTDVALVPALGPIPLGFGSFFWLPDSAQGSARFWCYLRFVTCGPAREGQSGHARPGRGARLLHCFS